MDNDINITLVEESLNFTFNDEQPIDITIQVASPDVPIDVAVIQNEDLGFEVLNYGIDGASGYSGAIGISGYSGATGAGAISGPVTSTNNAIARWDGTEGDALKDSSVLVDDNGGVYAKEFISVNDGSVTRVGGYISQVIIVGGRTIDITRINGYISSITDGTRTWTYIRDINNNIVSWTVT